MSAESELLSKVFDDIGEDLATVVADRVSENLSPSLESKTPKEAVEKYFEVRDFPTSTEATHWSSLNNHFVPWCEEIAEINDISELTGGDLSDYRVWRRDVAPERVDKLTVKSEETQQKILRKFIEYCGDWGYVRPGLHEHVIIPKVGKSDEVRDEVLDTKVAKEILTWLEKYEYASEFHVVFLLLAACGARTGDIHSLDLDDFVLDAKGSYLKFRHRPETGTTLKNDEDGERDAAIDSLVSSVLTDFIDNVRVDTTDEYGREPLLTIKNGRLAKSTIRNYVYAWTRPCAFGRECPYDRDPNDCKAARRNNWASQCPDSLSCHPVRKGYITAELKAGIPKAVLCERCDVSEEVMDKHYDHRTKAEKMKARRMMMERVHQTESRYGE